MKVQKLEVVTPVAKRSYTKSPKLAPRRPEKHSSHVFLTFLVFINLVATGWIIYQIYEAQYLYNLPQETPDCYSHCIVQ